MSTALKVYLLVSVILLSCGFFFLFSKMNMLQKTVVQKEQQKLSVEEINNAAVEPSPAGCDDTCKDFIKQEIKDSIAGESARLTPIPAPTMAVAQSGKKTSFVPLGGTLDTSATEWTDVPGSGVYLDLSNDFSNSAYVTWLANIKIANSNGNVQARIFDKTHSIAVQASEISSTSADFDTVVSDPIYLWQGNNLYVVQIKSLNSNTASYEGGKIKVVY